jgi:hypothetical protein
MARRCPESRYLGRGLLHDYRWQINTRGVANIYHSRGDTVEGLCFLLSQKDEQKLDINEGVQSGAYEKCTILIEVLAATARIAGRRVKEVNEHIHQQTHQSQDGNQHGQRLQSSRRAGNEQQQSPPVPVYHSMVGEKLDALVYVNWDETRHGPPRTEYIARINSGIEDAVTLGVPREYFERYVREPMEGRDPQAPSLSERPDKGRQQYREVLTNGRLPAPRRDLYEDRLLPNPNTPTRVDQQPSRPQVGYGVNYTESSPDQVRGQKDGDTAVPVADALHHRQGEDDGEDPQRRLTGDMGSKI